MRLKRFAFVFIAIFLLAAACNKQPVVLPNNQTLPQSTLTPKGQVYETDFLKVFVSEGWSAKQAKKIVYEDSCVNKESCVQVQKTQDNPGAVNITKGNYILYINTLASQASGVIGGRFGEIAGGAPSADAVVTEQPMECSGFSETNIFKQDHSRVDLYISKKDIAEQPWCKAPQDGSTVWYFSYVYDSISGGYFNYYKPNEGPYGYVITMAYNTKDVNKLPLKGSAELKTALSEMSEIAKSLEIKEKSKTFGDGCIDAEVGSPVITSLSATSGAVGTTIEIYGCNFSGFEGDKNAWIENSQGVRGILYGLDGSTSKLVKVVLKSPLCQTNTSYSDLPCEKWLTLKKGNYKIFVSPWAEDSNKLDFTIK